VTVSLDLGRVPTVARIPVAAYGWIVGGLWYGYLVALRTCVTVEYTGVERLSPEENYIFCQWHESFPLALQALAPRVDRYLLHTPHAWMQHPSWATTPIQVLLGLMGVERIVLGSTGHGGRNAADELVSYLRRGYSTALSPDGPKGPARVLKKGVLHMALQSGVPIVPIRFTGSRFIRSPAWDGKMHPLPFSSIRVDVGTPITVSEDTFDEAADALVRAMG
jgi:hypothetical protein